MTPGPNFSGPEIHKAVTSGLQGLKPDTYLKSKTMYAMWVEIMEDKVMCSSVLLGGGVKKKIRCSLDNAEWPEVKPAVGCNR